MTLARRLAALPEADRQSVLADLSAADLAQLEYSWPFWARPDQLPPPGNWRTWLLLGGRGSGKTRSAAEYIRSEVEAGRHARIAIVGPTADTIRRDMIEGSSGLLSVCPPWLKANYEPTTRRVVFENGAVVYLFSGEEPERLRGPNVSLAWCDELAAWQQGQGVWDNLQMALRVPGPKGDAPRVVISTTPRSGKLLRAILASPSTVVTRAKTSDNAANLDPGTLQYYRDRYAGTRLGRQELDAELLLDVEGALWSIGMFDAHRVAHPPLDRDGNVALARVIVGVDPSGGGAAETGIIVCGRAANAHAYVLADHSVKGSPETWGRRAVQAYHDHQADRIVAEKNFGGEMVASVIRSVDHRVPVKLVTASRGKAVRAEPVVSLYEQGKVHHVGTLSQLEDQMTSWDPNGHDASPDRLDALVWAITELLGAAPSRTTVTYGSFGTGFGRSRVFEGANEVSPSDPSHPDHQKWARHGY